MFAHFVLRTADREPLKKWYMTVLNARLVFENEYIAFITYDDERSIREKSRLVKEWGLRGAMYWELGADRDGVLGRAVASELRAPSPR